MLNGCRVCAVLQLVGGLCDQQEQGCGRVGREGDDGVKVVHPVVPCKYHEVGTCTQSNICINDQHSHNCSGRRWKGTSVSKRF